MEKKGKSAELCYPNIFFTVDNFDEVRTLLNKFFDGLSYIRLSIVTGLPRCLLVVAVEIMYCQKSIDQAISIT